MIYVVWLVLDGSSCRGGGGFAAIWLSTFLCLDLMLRTPLLPLLAVSRRKSDVLQSDR